MGTGTSHGSIALAALALTLSGCPDTGEVISCRGGGPRSPLKIYRGRSAKELGMVLTEGEGPHPISCLDHALYLGRELQKAERCLEDGSTYIQD